MSAIRTSVVFLGLAVLLAGCSRGSADVATAATPPPPAVTVAAVVAKPLRDWEQFTGRLEAVESVEVRPRVNGFIDSVQFAEGSRVRKGQLLFRIDPRPFQAEVNRLSAALKQARSQAKLAAASASPPL